jgi:hypothetical protein
MTATSRPTLMDNAKEDLAGTVEGKFSPEDWEKILGKAQNLLGTGGLEAWREVIRDFHRNRYWGFVPNYREPRKKEVSKNLGFQFIWMTFGSLTIFKVAVLWFGQIYSRSDDPLDKWLFFGCLALVLGNIAFFLWRNRNHVD